MNILDVYRGKKVFLTGDTGFKGAWLSFWLHELGAEIYGYALPPENPEWLFVRADLKSVLWHEDGDICDAALVRRRIQEIKPDIVFHLAAQSLVRRSYADPVATAMTNIMGTVHVLEALRLAGQPCAAVIVTSDKCYENREWPYAYRENDPMGGHDVYSMSKGAAELVVASYRRSFFPPDGPIAIASARAGNVIGPGDWALDRIVPDAMRTLLNGETLLVRNPGAVRPWQHVLEPLSGYLQLGALLMSGREYAWARDGWNFGPGLDAARTVADLADEIIKVLGRGRWCTDKSGPHPHEANFLRLSIEKAATLLGWRPVWSFSEAVRRTVDGYCRMQAATPSEIRQFMAAEIMAYTCDAAQSGCRWANDKPAN